MCKTEIGKGLTPQSSSGSRMFANKAIRITVPVLTVAGWLAAIAPSMAITASYNNEYLVCAGRIIRAGEGVTEQAVAQACARSLRPRDLASCVIDIKNKTEIVAADALSNCSAARRPKDYGSCVVDVSQNFQKTVRPEDLQLDKEATKQQVLTYCGRSLLPVSFAECVVGLRTEIKNLAPTQVLDTCIDGSDRIGGLPPSSTLLPTQRSTEFSPTFETTPIPGNETSPVPGNQTSPIPANPGSNY